MLLFGVDVFYFLLADDLVLVQDKSHIKCVGEKKKSFEMIYYNLFTKPFKLLYINVKKNYFCRKNILPSFKAITKTTAGA